MIQRHQSIKAFWLLIFFSLSLVTFEASASREPSRGAPGSSQPPLKMGPLLELRARDENSFTFVAPATDSLVPSNSQTATIQVTYNGFSAEAEAAFQYAVDLWEAQLTSPVTIRVNASWQPLGTGVLGSAGPYLTANFQNAPQSNVWYPYAIADRLAGTDIDPNNFDIIALFSSSFPNWYFGTDGNTPAGQYDFVTVVLHELGHGLGFVGSASVSGGLGSWGDNTYGYPYVYDLFVQNSLEQSIIDTNLFPNPSTELAAQLQSQELFFNSSNAVIANGGTPPKLYIPASWVQGSSYAHLDEEEYSAGDANSLMTPTLGQAEAIHNPGAITLGIFTDMGWIANDAATATPTRTSTATAITSTPTMVSTLTTTNTPTLTLTATIVNTPPDTPTSTPCPDPTFSPTNTPTITVTPAMSSTPTITITPAMTPPLTATPTITFTLTAIPTLTPIMTATATITASSTPSLTQSIKPLLMAGTTPTITPTITVVITKTATITSTITPTATPCPTEMPTSTPTSSRTSTPTSTRTSTPTSTRTSTPTSTRTSTSTSTRTSTPTPTSQTLYLPIILRGAGAGAPTVTATTTARPTATTTPTETSGGNAFEDEVIRLTNQERSKADCPALAFNSQLRTAAYGHSSNMALNDFFSHTSPDGTSPWDRIKETGYQYSTAAENIAAGYSSPEDVIEGWMNSQGHRDNILNCDLREIGVGYYYLQNDTGEVNYNHYWTQVFATPLNRRAIARKIYIPR